MSVAKMFNRMLHPRTNCTIVRSIYDFYAPDYLGMQWASKRMSAARNFSRIARIRRVESTKRSNGGSIDNDDVVADRNTCLVGWLHD